jgi:hypothetical protein
MPLYIAVISRSASAVPDTCPATYESRKLSGALPETVPRFTS